MGATAQSESQLAQPVNALEQTEDPHGVWRAYVNRQLAGDYAKLFRQLDQLIFLQVPDWGLVFQWRQQQERQLADSQPAQRSDSQLMNAEALRRFIMHFERITRHCFAEMPGRADISLLLDPHHQICNRQFPT